MNETQIDKTAADLVAEFKAHLEANLRTAESRVDTPAPPVSQAIEGWMPVGGKGLITGLPKTYKTTISIEQAVALAYGTDFLGISRVLAPTTNVLLIEEELTESELDDLLRQTMVARGIRTPDTWEPVEEHGGIHYVMTEEGKWVHPEEYLPWGTPSRIDTLVKADMNLLDPIKIHALKELLLEGEYGYFNADPLYLLTGGEQLKDEKTVLKATKALNDIQDETGASPILVNHTPWTQSGRSYGSVFLEGWWQWAWHIEADGEVAAAVDSGETDDWQAAISGDTHPLLKIDIGVRRWTGPRPGTKYLVAHDDGQWIETNKVSAKQNKSTRKQRAEARRAMVRQWVEERHTELMTMGTKKAVKEHLLKADWFEDSESTAEGDLDAVGFWSEFGK